MRLTRVRFTVRRMMVGVACVAVVVHLLVSAWRVYPVRRSHIHTSVVLDEDGRPGTYTDYGVGSPFWPRYGRCLLGMTWTGRRFCAARRSGLGEVCELEHPEICRRPNANTIVITNHPQSQLDLLFRLGKPFYPGRRQPQSSPLKF